MQTPHILIVEDELVNTQHVKSIFEAEMMYSKRPMAQKCIRSFLKNDINPIMDIKPGQNGLLLARAA